MPSSAVQLTAPVPRRVPWGFLGALGATTALGWAWSLQLASAGHHGLPLQARILMWTTMMVGMMVPPEVPALVRLARDGGREPVASASAVLGGYLAVWAVASAGLALLDARLGAWGLLTHEMSSRSTPLSVGILAGAGLVQVSPWKRACLERCRALGTDRSPGLGRALVSGVRHGVASVSSCGVLMLVLLVVGAMNWVAMGALTAFLIAERLVPAAMGPGLARWTGLGLLLWSGGLAVRAGLG